MNWLPYIPHDGDVQVSHIADFQACGSYSAIHIAEMLDRYHTGYTRYYSERALAKLSGTTPQGNSITNVVNAINQYGLISDDDWPEINMTDQNTTWAEYYAPIPQNVLIRADKGWKASLSPLSPSQVPMALNKAPVWTIIKTSGGEDHIVAQINETQYFDSYQILVKDFQPAEPIVSQWALQLTYSPQTNAQFINKKGTSEYGFYLPKMSENALKDMALNCGINILNSDGTINYNLAKEIM